MKANLSEPLRKIIDNSYSYADGYANNSSVSSVRFTESGRSRLAHTFGLISGIYFSGDVSRADYLARELFQSFDRLHCNSKIKIERPGSLVIEIPDTIIELSDDGGIGSFSICWYRHFIGDVPKRSLPNGDFVDSSVIVDLWGNKYAFFMNGALILHCSNHQYTKGQSYPIGTTFAERPEWSSHT